MRRICGHDDGEIDEPLLEAWICGRSAKEGTPVLSKRVPPVPQQVRARKSWPNHSPPDLVYADRKLITGVKNNTCFRITHGPAVLVQDFGQSRNYRHGIPAGSRLGKVAHRHPNGTIDRQLATRVIGPFESAKVFIPIYPSRLPTVPKPSRACRTASIVLNNLEASQSAITRLLNRCTSQTAP